MEAAAFFAPAYFTSTCFAETRAGSFGETDRGEPAVRRHAAAGVSPAGGGGGALCVLGGWGGAQAVRRSVEISAARGSMSAVYTRPAFQGESGTSTRASPAGGTWPPPPC